MLQRLESNPALYLLVYLVVAFGGVIGAASLGTWTSQQLYPDSPNYSKLCEDRGGEFYFKSGACRVGNNWIDLDTGEKRP